jgi:formylglycine-generating enzyme required for sulfatase activity
VDAAAIDASAFDEASDLVPSEASGPDVSAPAPPTSCDGASGPGLTDCGPDAAPESCCSSSLVPGGTLLRSDSAPASVSDGRLDRYEVTVARFRRFLDAVVGGWHPLDGSGKHTHLHQGRGLSVAPSDGTTGFEYGWSASSYETLPASLATWSANLTCGVVGGTWTPSATTNEALPITCASWFEAYAFCIWDHAFLPTEAEWNNAASGGTDQRDLPWGEAPADCAHANYGSCGDKANRPGSESPLGDSKTGQADLVGNVWEWVLDEYVLPYATPCTDCASMGPSEHVRRGGGFGNDYPDLTTFYRGHALPTVRDASVGFRCARIP